MGASALRNIQSDTALLAASGFETFRSALGWHGKLFNIVKKIYRRKLRSFVCADPKIRMENSKAPKNQSPSSSRTKIRNPKLQCVRSAQYSIPGRAAWTAAQGFETCRKALGWNNKLSNVVSADDSPKKAFRSYVRADLKVRIRTVGSSRDSIVVYDRKFEGLSFRACASHNRLTGQSFHSADFLNITLFGCFQIFEIWSSVACLYFCIAMHSFDRNLALLTSIILSSNPDFN